MANIAATLKEEITRMARKEIKGEIDHLRKASAHYRSDIAALKRLNANLERQISQLIKAAGKNVETKVEIENGPKVRFTANGFRTLRKRLGLTAESIGTLLDVSAQSIYNWEAGNSKPRAAQLARIVHLRGMGKRDVDAILSQQTR